MSKLGVWYYDKVEAKYQVILTQDHISNLPEEDATATRRMVTLMRKFMVVGIEITMQLTRLL